MQTDTLEKPTYTENKKNPYNYNDSVLKLLPKLNRRALNAGIPETDVEDVVQTALLNFWQSDRPSEDEMSRGVFRKVVMPSLYAYVRQAIDAYHKTQRPEETTDFELPVQFHSASNSPSFHFLIHPLWDEPRDKEPAINSAFTIDPSAERERDAAAFDRYAFFRREIFGALFDLNELDWVTLQKRYRFNSTSVRTYWALVKQPSIQTEEAIAEYVAFGIEGSKMEQILGQPDFYRALHDVLRSVEFVSPVEYYDEPRIERMRKTRTKEEQKGSDDYARLKARLTGKRASAEDITDLLTDNTTREKIGTSKLSRLWQLLPRHRKRKMDLPPKEMYGSAIDTLALKLESEYGLPSDIAQAHALEMPDLLKTY